MPVREEPRVTLGEFVLVVGGFAVVSLLIWSLNAAACDDPFRDFSRDRIGILCRPTGIDRGPGATIGETIAMVTIDGASVLVSAAFMVVAVWRNSLRWMWAAVAAGVLAVVGSAIAVSAWATTPPVPLGP